MTRIELDRRPWGGLFWVPLARAAWVCASVRCDCKTANPGKRENQAFAREGAKTPRFAKRGGYGRLVSSGEN